MRHILKACVGVLFTGLMWGSLVSPVAAQSGTFSASEIENAPDCGSYPVGKSQLLCKCNPSFTTGSVWGSGPYTADSNICTAALHSGAISQKGGAVLATAAAGQTSYSGTSRNGVTTSDWGSYGNSYFIQNATATEANVCGVMPQDREYYQCRCDAGRAASTSLWGNGPYTADSDLCSAARHSGVIGAQGGKITVLRLQGLSSYWGSTSNGVTSSDWGSFGSSIMLNRN